LHVGDEEDEPIEAAQAARRRRQRFTAARLPVSSRRGLGCDPATLIPIVARTA